MQMAFRVHLCLPAHISKQERAHWHKLAEIDGLLSESQVHIPCWCTHPNCFAFRGSKEIATPASFETTINSTWCCYSRCLCLQVDCSLTLLKQHCVMGLSTPHKRTCCHHLCIELFTVLCLASARELVLSASSTSSLAQLPKLAGMYQAKPSKSGIGAKWKGDTCGHTAKGKFRTCLDQVARCLLMCSNWYKGGVSNTMCDTLLCR